MANKRILHIEDDADNRRLVRKVLEATGFDVVEAVDGLSGIKLALSEKPDLVLVDINLPQLDGYEVTLKLRSELGERNIPIVAITAEGSRDMSLAVGCDGYISKPINVTEFPKRIKEFLAGYQEEDAPDADRRALLLAQSQKIVRRLETTVAQLTDVNRRLREADKIRSEFYRNISHELSTPLTPVVGYLSLLLSEELGPLTPLQRKCLKSVNHCYARIRTLIENLLDITALQTGRMNFFPRDYDFAQVTSSAVERMKPLFEEKKLEFVFRPPNGKWPGRGDPDKLARSMVQLLDNAFKFTEKGRVEVQVARRPEGFEFSVYDSGIGIDPGQIEAIFNSFYQVDGSVTRIYGGAGIGLAITQKIVDAFGGRVWAESPPKDAAESLSWAKTRVVFIIPTIMSRAGATEKSEAKA